MLCGASTMERAVVCVYHSALTRPCECVCVCCCSSQFGGNYLKKVLDENAAGEDTVRFLKFLCWENWEMSLVVLSELLTQVRRKGGGEGGD